MAPTRRKSAKGVTTILLAALFGAIYVPALGHGFVKDDFRWMTSADVRSPDDVLRIFATNDGFYRPLVTASFAMDRAIWNLDPRGYALTNLVLLIADAGLLFLFARRLRVPPAAALFAVAVWAFNFHGINMALLWISGRTALLMLVFALASALAVLRGSRIAAGVLTLCAMLCKEEAVMLPPLLTIVDGWHRSAEHASLRVVMLRSWPLWVAAAGYAVLREQSGAFGISNAPSYYQLTLDPGTLLRNVAEYLDRGATTAVLSTIALWIAVPNAGALTDEERGVVRIGALWFAAMYAITVFVPVRSSLYAVAPSIGSALVVAAFAARAARTASPRFARASAALIVAIALLVPVYRMRNHGLVEPADLATRSLAVIQDAARVMPHVAAITLVDDPNEPVTLDAAFGALFPEAVHLFVAPRVQGTLTSTPASGLPPPDDSLVFALRDGRLVQDRSGRPGASARTNGRPVETSASHSG